VVAAGRKPHRGRFQRDVGVDRARIDEALAPTDTVGLAKRLVTELSGGERQRVLIAWSLATKAPIILLDEPNANLDQAHALDVLELCRSPANAGTVVILTTQDLSMVVRYADRVALIKAATKPHGRLLLKVNQHWYSIVFSWLRINDTGFRQLRISLRSSEQRHLAALTIALNALAYGETR
jgi:ABC-type cobalamin/Fe3+-siderophores transport system ATPase subunit